MKAPIFRHAYWIAPLCLLAGVLGLWGTAGAQPEAVPGAGKPPFANAVDQLFSRKAHLTVRMVK